MKRLEVDHPALAYWAPRAPRRDPMGVRLDRFGPEAQQVVAGQIGPLANLRSSSSCAVVLRTDSPIIELHLARLRHHQPVSVQVALQWRADDGTWRTVTSADLRTQDGDVTVWLPTGLPAGESRDCWLWLPSISTCLVSGLSISEGAVAIAPTMPIPRWLILGDSLAQGFNVACPSKTWVHRVSQSLDMPYWCMGVGGLKIEPQLFAPVLTERNWEMVTVALGSNHSWRDSDVLEVETRAESMLEMVFAGNHQQIQWILPPWKPCEKGLGPPEFFGVPLDRRAGERALKVRAVLGEVLQRAQQRYGSRLQLLSELMPHDHRLLPDGLHPQTLGMQRYADNFLRQLGDNSGPLNNPSTQ